MDWHSKRIALSRVYRENIPNLAVLFLFPVSCWSTYSGLRDLLNNTSVLSDWEGTLIAAALTVGIQLTLLFSVNALTRSRGLRRPFFLVIYLITVFFSVLFGYSFYFRHLRAAEFAREVHERESRRLLEEGSQYQAQFESLTRTLTAMADYSRLRSEEENSRGGTCGDNSQSGRGPRVRGRAQDADIFAAYQGQLSSLVAAERADFLRLSEEVKAFDDTRLAEHQANLDRFHESLTQRQKDAGRLLSEINSYLLARFPEGNYEFLEGATRYSCPDVRMEQLAALLLSSSVPAPPGPPRRFLAQNPKAVVQFALEGLVGWLNWGEREGATTVAGAERADRLPLLLGLLVDGLILLAALAAPRSGAGRGLIEELHWLETGPGRLRNRFRQQLGRLLGCSPQQALMATVQLISRYQVAEHSRGRSGLSRQLAVALPQSGSFLDQYPELGRLRQLLSLLQSLSAARRIRLIRWSELPGPLPPGLALLRKEQAGLDDEALAIFELSDDVLTDLTREAFSGSDLTNSAPEGSAKSAEERDLLGYDPV